MPSTVKYEPSKVSLSPARMVHQGFGWVYGMNALALKNGPKNPVQVPIVGKVTLYEGGLFTVRGHRLMPKKQGKVYGNTVDVTASLATHRIHWADKKAR